jgi:hypothetical protein
VRAAGAATRALRRTAAALGLLLAVAGCATTGDGLDVATLPPDLRPDYAVFARRCSKCHSLARPLGSGISEDAAWVDYVDRMRRQPGSGISQADVAPILRFLHHYALEERRRRASASAGSDTGGE